MLTVPDVEGHCPVENHGGPESVERQSDLPLAARQRFVRNDDPDDENEIEEKSFLFIWKITINYLKLSLHLKLYMNL